MPGIVAFKRRWSVGSDDFVIPAVILLVLHTTWLIVLTVILGSSTLEVDTEPCISKLYEHVLGYMVILTGCIIVEIFISWVSMRGTILVTEPRTSMQYLLYVRLGILVVEVIWLGSGIMWLYDYYDACPVGSAKSALLGIVICNWIVLLSVLITLWCTFDAAGRTWVKMKRYQRSLREAKKPRGCQTSHRNWRHRKAMREYQDSWNRRCRLLFCCIGHSDRQRNNFAEIARLLSDFFRDLDVVPSDVVAGMMLLRKMQKYKREAIVNKREDETYQFLSGVPITPSTRFLDITYPSVAEEVLTVTHYFHYALAVYGWPMFMMIHKTGCCQLCPYFKCHSCRSEMKPKPTTIVEDNCCSCNYAALRRLCRKQNMEIVFATYHVEIGETPFFVALDHEKRTVVLSIRGTLSLQDIVTDLNAEAEQLPTEPRHEDWLGHKGMVQAAVYIHQKLLNEAILLQALNRCPEKSTQTYDLVLVGHSLGAGTAAILAILLKRDYPNLTCYAYSPPGGLLSYPAVEYTKEFITSVVLGKDVVPRIGLHQMEALRSDLINVIKRSQDPKWKIILGSMFCCCSDETKIDASSGLPEKLNFRDITTHPSDSSIALTRHQPLYPPGKIIHIVRNHPKKEVRKYESKWRRIVKKHAPVYQALWAENTDFDEVLISPVMVQDHMPDKVLDALNELLVNTGPAKPQRHPSETGRRSSNSCGPALSETTLPQVVLETSFTDLQPGPTPVLSCQSSARDSPGDKLAAGDSCPVERQAWAPLASPETLSEASSTSSRRSQQRTNDGNRPSWIGVPIMDPIAQSPETKKLYFDAGGVHPGYSPSYSIRMEPSMDFPGAMVFASKVVTQATIEAKPEEEGSPHLMDPSRLHLNIGAFEQHSQEANGGVNFGADSTYASTSTDQTIDKLFTPHEPRRVTFDLYSKQKIAREISEDSMYNSGESFVPTYPEYGNQQEYGNHGYMYSSCDYSSFSPTSSPIIEHSVSDVQLFKLEDESFIQLIHEKINMPDDHEADLIDEDSILTSSPVKYARQFPAEAQAHRGSESYL